MKNMLGVIAALLFVTTMALAQQLATPFPQAANPALENGTYAPAIAEQTNLPPSMAINLNSAYAFPLPKRLDEFGASPFPMAADPSPNRNEWTLVTFGEREQEREYAPGSPFPMAANPSENQ